MEALIPFTLFGSGIAFGLVLVCLFICFLIADLEESGTWATLAFVVFMILSYFWGDPDILKIFSLKNIAAYVLIGFFFSLIRTYFKGKELSPDEKKYFKLKDHVFRWWFLWWVSAITWIFGRLLKDAFEAVYRKIGKIYYKLFNA